MIGSHLPEAILTNSDHVLMVDDLSTGSILEDVIEFERGRMGEGEA